MVKRKIEYKKKKSSILLENIYISGNKMHGTGKCKMLDGAGNKNK